MNIERILKEIADDTGIHFHSFEQDSDIIIAKSHFFDFHFGPTSVDVISNYTLPGPRLKDYLETMLPFGIDYIVDNYYDILVEAMNEIHQKCIVCEYRDEEEYENEQGLE